jgi:methylated-DNA-[protein]-cysteine S-methyltransferase
LTNWDSPIGSLTVACTETSIVGVWFVGQKYYKQGLTGGQTQENPNHPILIKAKQWLDDYFAGKKPNSKDLQIAPMGSDFRRQVWGMLCKIPYGQTTTYGNIAKQIAAINGKAKISAQAVGGAVGHNPISIIIPCHRVVGASVSLTGYAGGLDKKEKLLKLEKEHFLL